MGIGLAHARQSLEFLILLPLPLECVDCRHVLPHPTTKSFLTFVSNHTGKFPTEHSVYGTPEGLWKMLTSAECPQLSGTHTIKARLA